MVDPHKTNIDNYSSNKAVEHYAKDTSLKKIEIHLIKKYFKGKILDLGCGGGRTTKYLSDAGYDVIGVDNAKKMVDKAKENSPNTHFEVGDACNLHFKDNSFEVVFFSFNGLDYVYPLKNRIAALKEICRVLKRGGHFVYSSHNSLSLLFNLRPRFLSRNIFKIMAFSKYLLDKDVFGTFHTFYASPKNQKKLCHQNTDLQFVEQLPKGIKPIFPHYVFKKN
tara:strand:+ start:753 stop:1418 length:666 start_codon:yes stop_codon:yes gene_type:complete